MFCKFCKDAPCVTCISNPHMRCNAVQCGGQTQLIRVAILGCRDAFIGMRLFTAQKSMHRTIRCYQASGNDNSGSCSAIDVLKVSCLVENGQGDQTTKPGQDKSDV